MRYVIVGGVAGGRGAAARLRRLDEEAEIIMLEKGEFISFANCGLPYYLSGVIADKEKEDPNPLMQVDNININDNPNGLPF